MIERDVVGGAAHLWDCIPSKTMIATGGAMSFTRRLAGMGLEQQDAELDMHALQDRIGSIKARLQHGVTRLLDSQQVKMIAGIARMLSPHEVEISTATGTSTIAADAVLIATGSRPRIPDWCQPDGDRILTTRECYPPTIFPESMTVIGSGVTGVEFVHMFSSFGAQVTLVVSRQQVLPQKDPEVAAVLEDDFLRRGVRLLKGARAIGDRAELDADGAPAASSCVATTVASCAAATPCSPSAPCPNTDDLGLEAAGVETRRRLRHHQPALPEQRLAHLRRRRRQRQAAAVERRQHAGPQGGRARDGAQQGRPPAPRLRQGGERDLHRAGDRRRRAGRGGGVRRGPQDPGHQGAVLGDAEGVDQRRSARASSS